MEGIFLLIILAILGLGLNYLNSLDGEYQKRVCDIHKWSYHPETKHLECTVCGYKAGS